MLGPVFWRDDRILKWCTEISSVLFTAMMSILEYKGYSARVELDQDDEYFVGRLAGINDVIGFHGSTIVGLKAAFHEAVDDYIETCRIVSMVSGDPSQSKIISIDWSVKWNHALQ